VLNLEHTVFKHDLSHLIDFGNGWWS